MYECKMIKIAFDITYCTTNLIFREVKFKFASF